MTEPSAEAREQAETLWKACAHGGFKYAACKGACVGCIARALAEKDAEIRDTQSRLLDEFVTELKALDPRPNQWRQTYPFSEAFGGIKALLAEARAHSDGADEAAEEALRQRDEARVKLAEVTPEDLARLTEDERELYADYVPPEVLMVLRRLAVARRVVEAASRWDHWGKVKVIHVLTCKECKRLEGAEDRWCEEASKIARTQLDAAKALQVALASHDAAMKGS